MAEDALDELGDVMADNVQFLVDSSSLAVEQTMKKVDQMDIESLEWEAISDLNDVSQLRWQEFSANLENNGRDRR